jgi:asparagine synthase (glutamine-hydrolysing)
VIAPTGRTAERAAAIAAALSLVPEETALLEQGALAAAWSPPDTGSREDGVTAVVAGRLHDTHRLAAALGLEPDAGEARLAAAAFRAWSLDALEQLRGVFALLVAERELERVVLAVDALGAGGLFWAELGAGLAFASEVTHLLAILPRRPAPDPIALAAWIDRGTVDPGTTLFDGVRRLDAGSAIVWTLEGRRIVRYWAPERGRTVDPEPSAVRARLVEATTRRIPPDAAVGVRLSGGLDSGTVAAAAVSTGHAPRAYSAVFPDHPHVDESELIEQVARELGIPNSRIVYRGGSVLADSIAYLDAWALPPVSPNLGFHRPLLQLAVLEGTTVVLDGEGGDELFGTTPYLLADYVRRGRLRRALRLARRLGLDRHDLVDYGLSAAVPERVRGAWRRLDPRRRSVEWLAPGIADDYAAALEASRRPPQQGPRWWSALVHTLIARRTAGAHDYLRQMLAWEGLEGGHPFLDDRDLVELVLSAPPERALPDERDRPLLRRATKGLTPDVVRLRRDKLFFDSVFYDAVQNVDAEAIKSVLGAERAELDGVVRRESRRGLLEIAPSERTTVWAWRAWRVTLAEIWLRTQSNPDHPAEITASFALPPAHYTLEPAD